MLALTPTHPLRPPLTRLPASLSPQKTPTFLPNPSPFLHPKPVTLSKSTPESSFQPELELESVSVEDDGFEIEVQKAEEKRNRRVIRSRIRVDADLETVWGVLTDYEGLADFIPSLAVSQLMEKGEKFARLYQVGQQDLALGLKFDAKGVLECYEQDVEYLPSGRRREIEFKMVEGDFQTFEGRWSIEQIDSSMCKDGAGQEFQTTLSYVVELEPKLWLPVHLLEGRLCKEVKNNLVCVREEAQRVQKLGKYERLRHYVTAGKREKMTLTSLVDDKTEPGLWSSSKHIHDL